MTYNHKNKNKTSDKHLNRTKNSKLHRTKSFHNLLTIFILLSNGTICVTVGISTDFQFIQHIFVQIVMGYHALYSKPNKKITFGNVNNYGFHKNSLAV